MLAIKVHEGCVGKHWARGFSNVNILLLLEFLLPWHSLGKEPAEKHRQTKGKDSFIMSGSGTSDRSAELLTKCTRAGGLGPWPEMCDGEAAPFDSFLSPGADQHLRILSLSGQRDTNDGKGLKHQRWTLVQLLL